MIIIQKNNFLNMLEKRGYSLEDVELCIKQKHQNDNWLIDETHPSYPRPKNKTHEQFLSELPKKQNIDLENGAGSELKKLLKMIGITSSPDCSCNTKAKVMNQNGIQWCKDNIDTIVGWLKEEAEKRNLPFFTYGAKKLVKLAISRAENAKSS